VDCGQDKVSGPLPSLYPNSQNRPLYFAFEGNLLINLHSTVQKFPLLLVQALSASAKNTGLHLHPKKKKVLQYVELSLKKSYPVIAARLSALRAGSAPLPRNKILSSSGNHFY
jgi:hypothetical protein